MTLTSKMRHLTTFPYLLHSSAVSPSNSSSTSPGPTMFCTHTHTYRQSFNNERITTSPSMTHGKTVQIKTTLFNTMNYRLNDYECSIFQGWARDLSGRDRDETRDAKVRDRDETETFQLPRPWPRRAVKKLSTTKSTELVNTLYL